MALGARRLPQQTQSLHLRGWEARKSIALPSPMWQRENTGDDLGQPLGRRDAKGSKGRSLPGYGFARLSGGASEVLGRAAWAPVLHLLLGHLESPAWPPSHSDNRKVNIPPTPRARKQPERKWGCQRSPPRLRQPARGYLYPSWGHGLGLSPYPSYWVRRHLGDNGGEGGRGSSGYLQT